MTKESRMVDYTGSTINEPQLGRLRVEERYEQKLVGVGLTVLYRLRRVGDEHDWPARWSQESVEQADADGKVERGLA